MEIKAVPIINENDPIATEELDVGGYFSDNDELAALCAIYFNAELYSLAIEDNIQNSRYKQCYTQHCNIFEGFQLAQGIKIIYSTYIYY